MSLNEIKKKIYLIAYFFIVLKRDLSQDKKTNSNAGRVFVTKIRGESELQNYVVVVTAATASGNYSKVGSHIRRQVIQRRTVQSRTKSMEFFLSREYKEVTLDPPL